MSVGILLHSKIPGELGGSLSELEPHISAVLERVYEQECKAQIFRCVNAGDELQYFIHPAAEPLFVRLQEGKLEVQANTSSGGPGYHVAVVEGFDALASSLGFDWEWDDDAFDETGYFQDRNFDAVVREMVSWLSGIAGFVSNNPDMVNVQLAMPLGGIVPTEFEIISPMGYWPRQWFASFAALDETMQVSLASQFFAWWGRERDRDYWKGVAQALCWVDLPWHQPKTETESRDYAAALYAFEQADWRDAPEYAEIQYLLELDEMTPHYPEPSRMGFRRVDCTWRFAANWRVALPGQWYHKLESDGTCITLWWDTRTVRGTGMSVSGAPFETLVELICRVNLGGEVVVDEQIGALHYRAQYHESEMEGKLYGSVLGAIVREGGYLQVTINFERLADRDWAIETFKRIVWQEGGSAE